ISSEAGGIYLGTIDSTSVTRLADPYSNTVFVGGRLLYVVDGMVVARSLDAERARLTDEAIEVAGPVAFAGALGFGAFSASTTGMIDYASGGAFAASRVSWVDRGGKTLGEFAAGTDLTRQAAYNQRLSPDGRRIVLNVYPAMTSDIWIVDVARDVPSRFTFDP